MKWIKASERLPLHKAHWNTNKYGYHDNDFPVRMNGRYYMANIFDEAKADDSAPIYMLKFESAEHYENQFSEIEWLDERESEPLYTDRDMEKLCQWLDEEAFCFRKQFNDWHCHIGGPHYTWEQLRALYLKTRIPSFKQPSQP